MARKYANLDGTTPDKRIGDILQWQIVDRLSGKARRRGREFVTPRRENDGRAIAESAASLTWVGHATFAMKLGGKVIATDPIWSERIQSVVKRRTAPGVALGDMPKIDVVTVSHAHFDHFDLPTLKRIGPEATYVVPRDNGALLRDAGLTQVVELDWWESYRLPDGALTITLVPAQHWSMRMPWDRNTRLWGGFVYESAEGTAYHAGDTAFSEDVFRAIGERFPAIDWALLPIGAYDPVWFMSPQHMGPEEAGRAWELCRAKTLCAMHWGTFDLTDEPPAEPPQRMRAWWQEHGHDPERLWIFDIGETRAIGA